MLLYECIFALLTRDVRSGLFFFLIPNMQSCVLMAVALTAL
jgi:hypothetical protein